MSDIFREVDEALQKEKAAKLWKEYGPTLILAAVVLVAATGITTAYRAWSSNTNKAETAKLVMAADEKDIAAAMERASGDTDSNHKAIALMNAASKAASDNNFAKAAELYGIVADDTGTPKDLRDSAIILHTRAILLGKETPDYKVLVEKLKPIAASTRSPFTYIAKVELAVLYGDGLKDYGSALKSLDGIEENETLSASIKEKAAALKRVYAYEQSQK